jgi:hypothetical protein
MVDTIPERIPLGASTTNRKWWLDVQDPAAPGIFVGVFGITEFKPKPGVATTQDDGDFDGGGYKSSTVTALEGGAEGKLARKTLASDPTAYDPGQEILRRTALKMGSSNSLVYRMYEMEPGGPRVEAYQGRAAVTWDNDGGNQEALGTVSFALVGQGKLSEIPHPEGVAAVPVVSSILPVGAAAGDTVVIEGAHFDGLSQSASTVKFDGTNATSVKVLSNTAILAVVPAGSAGLVPVTVSGADPVLYQRGA